VPLYEYECARDGRFELIRKFSDPPLTTCPTCGQPVEKLLSSPAIQFKGTGWYVTDYARKGNGGGRSKGESRADDSAKGADSKDGASKSGAKDGAAKDSSTAPGSNK
jgi:putative FmdB family regulatory protein